MTNHDAVGFTPGWSTWKLEKDNDEVEVSPRMSIVVNSGQAVRIAARAGLGVIDLPLNFHPAAVRASAALNTPNGAV